MLICSRRCRILRTIHRARRDYSFDDSSRSTLKLGISFFGNLIILSAKNLIIWLTLISALYKLISNSFYQLADILGGEIRKFELSRPIHPEPGDQGI